MAKHLSKTLPCRLTEQELSARSQEVFTGLTEIERMEATEKDRKKSAKKDIDDEKKRILDLRRQIDGRVEHREVRCEEKRNDQLKTMDLIRLDDAACWIDNKQIVNQRPLTPNELQIELLSDHRRDRDASIPADEANAEPKAEGEESTEAAESEEPDPFEGVEPVAETAEKGNKRKSPKNRS